MLTHGSLDCPCSSITSCSAFSQLQSGMPSWTPSLACRLPMKLSCTSALRGPVDITSPCGDLGMPEHQLPWGRGFWRYVDHSGIHSSCHPYFFITVLRGQFPPASLLCFFFHLLCSFQKNLVCPSRTAVARHSGEDYQHPCDFVRYFASKVGEL